MSDPLAGNSQEQGSGGTPRVVALIAFAVAAAAAAFLWYSSGRKERGAPAAVHLAFGAAEQAYAPMLRVQEVTLARAENYLHQEVTTISGKLVNTGDRAVSQAEFILEFQDDMQQVVLRHTFISAAPQPLAAKSTREVEISLEHIPSAWNNREPAFRVVGLEFSAQR